MKVSAIILPVTMILVLLITSLFVSNVSLKKGNGKVNTNDLNQTYGETYLFAKYEF